MPILLRISCSSLTTVEKNTITSTLELFGEPNGYSAMSKSVGLTCGIATHILLNGDPAFNKPGVLAPYSREICKPIRTRVEAEGIKLIEKIFLSSLMMHENAS